MKKLDFVIIGIVLIVVSVLFGTYFHKLTVRPERAMLEIVYQNEVVDTVQYSKTLDAVYTFEALDDTHVKITIQTAGKEQEKTITARPPHHIHNVVTVRNGTIKMTEANCPHHDCLHMYMNGRVIFPIICTNGVMVRFRMMTPEEVEVLV